MPLPYIRKIFVICTSSAKYCQVFHYAPYMEWVCTQCVNIKFLMSKIKSFKYTVFVGECGIIAKIWSRQNIVDKPGIFPVL